MFPIFGAIAAGLGMLAGAALSKLFGGKDKQENNSQTQNIALINEQTERERQANAQKMKTRNTKKGNTGAQNKRATRRQTPKTSQQEGSKTIAQHKSPNPPPP